MLGTEGAIARIVHRLTTQLPTTVAAFRARYGVDAQLLPDAKQILDYEPDQVGVEATPTVYVVEGPARSRQSGRRVGASPYSDGWAYVYTIRVFLLVRGGSYADTQQRSRRLTLAIRETLMGGYDYPPTPDEPSTVEAELRIDPATLGEEYSDVDVDRAGRTMRGSYVQVDFRSQEFLTAYPAPTTTELAGVVTDVVPL